MAGGNKDPNSSASRGLPGAGLSDIEGLSAIIEALEKTEKGSKEGAKELQSLQERMSKLSKEAKKSKDPIAVLSKAFGVMRERGTDAGDAIEVLTEKIQESVGVMNTSSRASLEDTIENIKKMQADMVAKGKGNTREAVMLNAKRSQLEFQAYKDQKNFMIERAKVMQTSLNPLKMVAGVGFGTFNAAAKGAVSAAEGVGQAIGLTRGAMMLMTEVLIAVTLPFLAFIGAVKMSSKQIREMTEAGETQASSEREMMILATQYQLNLKKAASDSNITVKDLQEMMVTLNKEMGRSSNLGADFAGAVANIGLTFGMSGQEAVKFSTKMAVAARSQGAGTLRAFTALGMHAANLKLPLEALADPMMQLADLAGRTGHNINSASNSMNLMIQSVESLKTSGIAVFKNMQGADVARFTKEFTGFINGIDEWMLAAMTFKDQEDFQAMTERVAGMDANARVRAIKEMMQDNELFGPQHASELGMILGARTPSEALQRGKIAQAAVQGQMSDSEYNRIMAKDINRQLAERKTAGEAIQFGVDPVAFMMDKVANILKTLIDIQNTMMFWKDVFGTSKPGATPRVLNPVAAAASNYGAAPVAAKRANLSIPVRP